MENKTVTQKTYTAIVIASITRMVAEIETARVKGFSENQDIRARQESRLQQHAGLIVKLVSQLEYASHKMNVTAMKIYDAIGMSCICTALGAATYLKELVISSKAFEETVMMGWGD